MVSFAIVDVTSESVAMTTVRAFGEQGAASEEPQTEQKQDKAR
jgi:hypothetical protein